MPLSDSFVRMAKPRPKSHKSATGKGFMLRSRRQAPAIGG